MMYVVELIRDDQEEPDIKVFEHRADAEARFEVGRRAAWTEQAARDARTGRPVYVTRARLLAADTLDVRIAKQIVIAGEAEELATSEIDLLDLDL